MRRGRETYVDIKNEPGAARTNHLLGNVLTEQQLPNGRFLAHGEEGEDILRCPWTGPS